MVTFTFTLLLYLMNDFTPCGKRSVSVMKSVYLIRLCREVIPLCYEKINSPWMHSVCIKDSRRKESLKLREVNTRTAMRVSSLAIRIKLAAACTCLNRVTQHSSFWVVQYVVGFPTHEDRSSISSQGMSCFHFKPTKKDLKTVSDEVAKHYIN
jgi:hypothetical protein